ncbi:MAG: DUF2508 family protein [Eubacteriales bacterium]
MTQILTLPQKQAVKTENQRHISKKHRKFLAQEEAKRRVALIDSIKLTQQLLRQAYGNFQETTDPDLLESYIYEINALQSRHNFLSKQLK